MLARFFEALFQSVVSLFGAVLTTLSALLFLGLLLAAELNPSLGGGYTGIVTFLLLPPVFVLGLVLMPIGLSRARRRKEPQRALVIDFNHPRTRAFAVIVGVLTLANLAIIATATWRGVGTMESTEFCGGACHSVMAPEATAHQAAPHAKVQCTKCHIGSGAEWFVRGKASGVRQLVSVALGTHARPIPPPGDRLRTSTETCEHCHSRDRAMRDRLHVIDRFADDETNTWKKTVLLVPTARVHWHLGGGVRLATDEARGAMLAVERPLADGGVRRWRNVTAPPGAPALRPMECIDCHNRPAHAYRPLDDELDEALARGEVDRRLPFLKREARRILQQPWRSHDDAREGIARELRSVYGPDAGVEPTAEALFRRYARNVFPSMNVGWGTYPDFRDHRSESGCYRCHSSDLVSDDGVKIPTRCETCHTILAEEEEHPDILQALSGE